MSLADLPQGPDGKPAPRAADTNVTKLPARRYEATEQGTARRLIDAHGHDLLYVSDMGRWHVWTGDRWAHDVTGERQRRVKDVVEDIGTDTLREPDPTRRKAMFRHYENAQTSRLHRGILEVAASELEVVTTVDQLDADPWLLNVANGTLNLRTGALREHRREDLMTKLAPVTYDPDATCPTWDWFLDWITCGDQDLATYLQRLAGYTLTGTVTEQLVAFAHGAGANGKSTFLNALETMLGLGPDGYALAAAPTLLVAARHQEHPTVVADLVGRRLIVCQEIEQGARLDEVRTKALTGGDPIKARFMRGDYFTFQPTGKLWLAANHKPRIRGTDHAIWRRMKLVPFAATVTDEDRDPHLPDRLHAELSGILTWAIQGCLQWQAHGLTAPAAVTAATNDYRASQDIVAAWIAERCELDDCDATTAADLYRSYTAWCQANGERAISQKALAGCLYEHGLDREQDTHSRTSRWIGIRVVNTEQPTLPT